MQTSHTLKVFSGIQWSSSRNIRNFPSDIILQIFQIMWNDHINSYHLVYPTDNKCMDSYLKRFRKPKSSLINCLWNTVKVCFIKALDNPESSTNHKHTEIHYISPFHPVAAHSINSEISRVKSWSRLFKGYIYVTEQFKSHGKICLGIILIFLNHTYTMLCN